MSYSKKYKFIFFHIPKNAGCTINDYLSGASKQTLICPSIGYVLEKDNKLKSCYANLIDYLTKKENIENYFRFTFVRNPYDKLVSAWAYARELECFNISFEYFVRYLNVYKKNLHILWHGIMSQTSHLTYCNKLAKLDYIGKVETLEEDLFFITKKLKLSSQKIKRLNITKHKHWSQYYNKELKDLVYKRFEEDFINFNYKR